MAAKDVQQRDLDGGGKRVTFPVTGEANSEAFGTGAAARANGTAVGHGATAGVVGADTDAVAVGKDALAQNRQSTVVGTGAVSSADGGVAVGRGATASGLTKGTAVGDLAKGTNGGTAIGADADSSTGGVAIGKGAVAANGKSAQVGSVAQPIEGFQVTGSVATAPFGISTFLASQDVAALTAIRGILGVDIAGIAFFINNGAIVGRVCRLGPAGAVAGLPAGAQVMYIEAAGP
jgi:hypothetical protein